MLIETKLIKFAFVIEINAYKFTFQIERLYICVVISNNEKRKKTSNL